MRGQCVVVVVVSRQTLLFPPRIADKEILGLAVYGESAPARAQSMR